MEKIRWGIIGPGNIANNFADGLKESNKGNELTKQTYSLLESNFNNFIGNIEPRYILNGEIDILICDGFTGNIVLKLTEGFFDNIFNFIIHDSAIFSLRYKFDYIFI